MKSLNTGILECLGSSTTRCEPEEHQPVLAGVDDATQQFDGHGVEVLLPEPSEEVADEIGGGHVLLAILLN